MTSRRWRWPALIGGLLLATLVACHVGVAKGARFAVVDAGGAPVADAVVAYSYEGPVFNFVDSISYRVPGSVVRSDAHGRIVIPARVYRKRPFDGWAKPWVELVYSPRLHLARGAGRRVPGTGAELVVGPGGRRLCGTDLSDDPEAWERSLESLERLLWANVIGPRDSGRASDVAVPLPVVRELTAALHREYSELQARHATTPRRAPPSTRYLESLPPSQQTEVRTRVATDLARDRLWGPVLERRWRRRLDQLDGAISRLP